MPLIECVPNFSEGRDRAVIDQIAATISAVEGVTLLDVDPGRDTNRTVMTFVGEPAAVVEGAVAAGRMAAELIDMTRHTGAHPRFGAMDVCPLIPIRDIEMGEVVEHAKELGRRLGEEVGLTVYLYERAASADHRSNLAAVRSGEYEGLADKLADPAWQPDFGPATLVPRSGATAVGARNILVAFNVNLNTTSTRRANSVAFDVREKGRIKRRGDRLTGDIVRDAEGAPVWEPGSLPAVKAIGWYIDEYGIAQVSMNLTDASVTPPHVAFDEVCERAAARGMRVTGSELVGMIPLEVMREAGRHYLRKQQRSLGVPDRELVKIAIKSMGLDDLAPFDPHAKIIEWRLAQEGPGQLVDLPVTRFVEETASESVAPGGGSVAAIAGALAAALGTMVANVASHKRGWDDRWEEFSEKAQRGTSLHKRLLRLVDEDTNAFNAVLAAYRLPRDSDAEAAAQSEAIQRAVTRAIEVPLEVMKASLEAMRLTEEMARSGPDSAVSDAAVGALMAVAAVRGAHFNVRTNAPELLDEAAKDSYLSTAREREAAARLLEETVLSIVDGRLT